MQVSASTVDAHEGSFSTHLTNGSSRLYVYISLLFDSMLRYGFAPSDFSLSTPDHTCSNS